MANPGRGGGICLKHLAPGSQSWTSVGAAGQLGSDDVLELSRIREEWDRTHDNTASVAAGLQRSGRIITSAALLLAVVIGGFATSGIVFLKMIGVAMLVAVLLDATIVRALLVPATMRLLGNANWWAPGPLRRWWERHGLGESDPVPAQQPELVGADR